MGFAVGRRLCPADTPPWRLALTLAAFGALAVSPDLDVLGSRLGLPYGHVFGHRGATHSLGLALLFGLLSWIGCRALGRSPRWAVGIVVALASHGILDAATNGGLGVALLWPLSAKRFFFPWRPLPVVPIGLRRLFALARGREALALELGYFAPLWVYALLPRRWLGLRPGRGESDSDQSALSAQQRKPLAGKTTSSTACESTKLQESPKGGV